MTPHGPVPHHACQVFRAEDFVVTAGANLGDPLDPQDELCPGDVYTLHPEAETLALWLSMTRPGTPPAVAPGSPHGAPGDTLCRLARLTLMASDGDKVELLAIEHRPAGRAQDPMILVVPLSPVARQSAYTLLQVDRDPGEINLSDLICVSLARGTRITMGDGRQTPIEELAPGDRVLTRDHGARPVRWVGRATLRGVGAFAPVVITAGTMGNTGDLIVSQHHRMFLYQRRRSALVATSELLVQAKHLTDGEQIFVRPGGYVDYFSLVFDRHEIIYAEGIPAESLLINAATLAHLPAQISTDLRAALPELQHNQHFGTEASRRLLEAIGRDALIGPGRGGGRPRER